MASRPENFPKGVLFININTDIRVCTEGKTRFAVPTSYELIWEHLNLQRILLSFTPFTFSHLLLQPEELPSVAEIASELAARVQLHCCKLRCSPAPHCNRGWSRSSTEACGALSHISAGQLARRCLQDKI